MEMDDSMNSTIMEQKLTGRLECALWVGRRKYRGPKFSQLSGLID